MTETSVVDLAVEAEDGVALAATQFTPTERAETVVIINSAMAVARRFYGYFAAYLAGHGIAAITYDYRGIGDSLVGHARADRSRLYEWGELDFTAIVRHAQQAYPGARHVVAGHSVGSQIVGLSPVSSELAGFVMVASQSGYWRNWHGAGRVMMFALWHLVLPGFAKTVGFVPGSVFGSSASLPGTIALDWARFGRDPRYIRGRRRRRSDACFERLAAPILAWHVSDDPYAPRRALEALLEFYPHAPKEVRTATPAAGGVTKLGHFGWFRKEGGVDFWDQTRAWIEALS